MYLVEQHIISVNDKRYKDLDRICFLSKNLYNAALYEIKQEFLRTGKWIRYTSLDRKLKDEDNFDYRAISAASSQQILMSLDKSLKSYFFAIKAWKRDNKKFTGCPKFPKYKHKTKGRNVFPYSYAQFKHRDNYIFFPKKEGLSPLKTNCKEGSVKQVRFVPKPDCYIIEVVYESKVKEQLPDNNRVMSIDLGVNNLASIVTNVSKKAILIDGRKLKSINQYYNKKKSKIQQQLKKTNGKENSRRLMSLTRKRNNKVKDYLHKASKEIINICLEDNITTLIVGHNDGWKQNTNLGKRNNQNFVSIPFETFISMLRYKSERQGLRFVEVNESHTSKCSSFDLEPVEHHDPYVGKRVKRGLFKTKDGILLNADINGSYNIMRKVKGDAAMPPYTGFGYNPVKKFIN
jgi:putative transposase